MIPKKIYVPENSIKCLCHYNNSALALVTNSQKIGSVEYTDLSQIWHNADENPQVERQVLGIDYDGEAGSGVFEYRSVAGIFIYGDLILDWDSVVRWAYIDDLLPKGGD